MIRWKYVIPRFFIGLLLACLFYFGGGPGLKWLLTHTGQKVTGARVDIRGLDIDWLDGKLQLEDIEIADPREPMQNLVQYQAATLDLDPGKMLRKEFVVEHAEFENVQFGTPRTRSGELEQGAGHWPAPVSWGVRSIALGMRQLGSQWLEQFEGFGRSQLEDHLETVRVAKTLNKEWETRYRRFEHRTGQIEKGLVDLKQIAGQPRENPLRELEKAQHVIREVNRLTGQANQVRKELNQLDDLLKRDQRRLESAKSRDEARIRQAAKYYRIDADSTTQLLLGKQKARYVEEVFGWLNWFQNAVPDPKNDFSPKRLRGEDIVFAGLTKKPKFLIKEASVSGQARIGGERFRFRGIARNLSTQPSRVEQPSEFLLSAEGPRPIKIEAIVDRRTEIKKDSILIELPEYAAAPLQLGSADSLMVNLGPSKIRTSIKLQVTDDELSGTLLIEQKGVQISLLRLNSLAGSDLLASELNRHFAKIEGFQVKIELGGTRDQVEAKLESDLGGKIAQAFGKVVNHAVETTVANQRQNLKSRMDNELAKLQSDHRQKLEQLLNRLSGDRQMVAQIRGLLNPARNQLPKIR